MEGNKNSSDINNINDKVKTLEKIDKINITNVLPPTELKQENIKLTDNKLSKKENHNDNINDNLKKDKDNLIKNNNQNQDNEILKEKEKNDKTENGKDNKDNLKKENNDMNGNNKNKDLNQKENGKENESNKNIIDDKKNNKPPQEKITKEKYMTRLPELKGTGCRNVNNYKIIEDHIGEGTFGMVFKAEYVGNMDYAEKMGIPKIVALKKIKMEDNKEGFPITALREIMIMKKCHHENLLQILEIVTSKSLVKNQKKQNVYLVFEYMEHDLSGLTLSKYRFGLPQVKYIMYQLLKGVQYLHHNNIIHRDIKCANILINNRGQIKIGDFGLARNITPNHTKEYTYKVVTLWFRAPELLFGEKFYGTAIDVWSCGCVFGELLTGKCPFQGKDEEALVNKICEKCGTPNETNWPGVTKLPLYNKYIPRTNFPNSFNETYKNVDNIDEVSLDLFSKMLQLDPKKRITIDEALKHPFFHNHQPSMCTAKEMPKFDREYHEFEYSRYHKKIKEEGQKVAKGDYMNKQNIHNNIKNSPKTFFNKNNNINNNKEFHNNFLGKKHYQDKNNYNNNRNYKDRWGDYS